MPIIADAGERPGAEQLGGRKPEALVEVLVEIEEEAPGPVRAELLWALPVEASGREGLLEVVGLPFFCDATVRRGDIVRAVPVEHPRREAEAEAQQAEETEETEEAAGAAGRAFLLQAVVEDGGHEALPVVLPPETAPEELDYCAEELADLGARVQTGYGRIIAVDLPPDLDEAARDAVYALLQGWDRDGLLAGIPPAGDKLATEPSGEEPSESRPTGQSGTGTLEPAGDEDPWEEAASEPLPEAAPAQREAWDGGEENPGSGRAQ